MCNDGMFEQNKLQQKSKKRRKLIKLYFEYFNITIC